MTIECNNKDWPDRCTSVFVLVRVGSKHLLDNADVLSW